MRGKKKSMEEKNICLTIKSSLNYCSKNYKFNGYNIRNDKFSFLENFTSFRNGNITKGQIMESKLILLKASIYGISHTTTCCLTLNVLNPVKCVRRDRLHTFFIIIKKKGGRNKTLEQYAS